MTLERVNKCPEGMFLFYNRYAEGECIVKKMSAAEFENHFFAPIPGFEKVFIAAYDGEMPVGFASGCIKCGSDVSYITYVLVDSAYRRRGLGTKLLSALERELTEEGTAKYEAVFYNPMSIPWIVPSTGGHNHPGLPGVDMISEGYIFMNNMGYRDYADQNAYHINLSSYSLPENMVALEERAAAEGLGVAYYDKSRHIGLEELMDSLKSEGWKRSVLNNEAKERPLPLLVAEDRGVGGGKARAVGFTGPVAVQESGRGYLAGIGVHPDYRGHGLGKLLFARLCDANKAQGATFMTLFTGESNPARNIYEGAGMKIARCFSCMRKVIKK